MLGFALSQGLQPDSVDSECFEQSSNRQGMNIPADRKWHSGLLVAQTLLQERYVIWSESFSRMAISAERKLILPDF